MKKRTDKPSSETLHRVPVVMPLELSDYLDEVGSEAKRGGGYKIAKTTIIKALIRAMQAVDDEVRIDLDGVKDEAELKRRLLKAYKEFRAKKG